MDRVQIRCDGCERLWSVAGILSFYEKQAMEARPCPQCGGYTLRCEEPLKVEKTRKRRKEMAAAR